ncbi:MAG TPA: 8-amino-7-oxononanoate synthase [Polyangiaceae bacterium LLY-WYZ-15_(1-7)]|nr:8-amino-7-oxononanoate synthase [Polyangiaceae bacterium LLY-WYZ-15_(1-7)]HJL03121.1 8-amino-7-oxononanoate synthase [Polyangiaceae bacterium LLY-WYZ-15_(1-7)]HJL08099.1 8-amino-7-oxononanoate synthase [Polyangiaceae bacterium LLY-WYZ-15_(1-7)]HJL24033.1 8-amino-7-oxononanoate synthase [Polyangiaceae bacterium LLY-WYZ-15_(1-7)]HJL37792.1 8-amino-7-oxononanoate synthase [Polyangiaceae bacterium LLY-WYZ-15_(1-7)]
MTIEDELRWRLEARRAAGLLRELRPLHGAGPRVRQAGRDLLNFCSNDYLGFASDPRLLDALRSAAGVGAPASRLITGHLEEHEATERLLASLVRLPEALLFTSGFAANLGTIPALVGPDDVVFSDALNHASLIDGCRLSRARVEVYPHGDLEALEQALRARRGAGNALIVSDAVFSMDGDVADVAALRGLADIHDAWLMVDEAHGLGVFGPQGAGVCAAAGVQPDVLVGTLGKSFGASGAFVAGAPALRAWLINRARSFVFSTAYPAALLPVLRAAASLVEAADDRRRRVLEHAERIRREARGLGYEVPEGESPIIPVLVGSNERAIELGRALEERGVLVVGIRPPTVPRGTARLRITPMATHTDTDVDHLLEALAAIRSPA